MHANVPWPEGVVRNSRTASLILNMRHRDRVVSGTGRMDVQSSADAFSVRVDGGRIFISPREAVTTAVMRVSNAGREFARFRIEQVDAEAIELVELSRVGDVVAHAYDGRRVLVWGGRFR